MDDFIDIPGDPLTALAVIEGLGFRKVCSYDHEFKGVTLMASAYIHDTLGVLTVKYRTANGVPLAGSFSMNLVAPAPAPSCHYTPPRPRRPRNDQEPWEKYAFPND